MLIGIIATAWIAVLVIYLLAGWYIQRPAKRPQDHAGSAAAAESVGLGLIDAGHEARAGATSLRHSKPALVKPASAANLPKGS